MCNFNYSLFLFHIFLFFTFVTARFVCTFWFLQFVVPLMFTFNLITFFNVQLFREGPNRIISIVLILDHLYHTFSNKFSSFVMPSNRSLHLHASLKKFANIYTPSGIRTCDPEGSVADQQRQTRSKRNGLCHQSDGCPDSIDEQCNFISHQSLQFKATIS